MKNLLLGIGISLVALPAIAAGASVTASLIAGKTPEEAVIILADQLDLLLGRVEVVEQKQAVTEQKQVTAETAQAQLDARLTAENAALAEQNRLLQQRAQALEASSTVLKTEVEQAKAETQKAIELATPPPPFVSVKASSRYWEIKPDEVATVTGDTERMLSIRLEAEGNTKFTPTEFMVRVTGNITEVRLAGSNGTLGSASVVNGIARIAPTLVVPRYPSIPPDESRDFIFYATMANTVENEPQAVTLSLESITGNGVVTGLPLQGVTYELRTRQ